MLSVAENTDNAANKALVGKGMTELFVNRDASAAHRSRGAPDI